MVQTMTEENKTPATSAESVLKFRKVRSVTRPVLKLEVNTEYYLKIEEVFRTEVLTEEQRAKSKYPESESITLVNVTDLETGEAMQLVVRTVFSAELIEAYPGDAYVGKCFAVKMSNADGKRYKVFSIQEIELEPEAPAEKPAKK